MTSKAITVDQYFEELPAERLVAMNKLRKMCKSKLKGFEETMSYGMLTYCVPHKKYPEGYHCDPKQPLPFISIASQKNFLALYHMGIYADAKLLKWFTDEFPKHSKSKLDMGKSCIRFKKIEDIPFKLIEDLLTKMTIEDWINLYSSILDTRKKEIKKPT